MASITDSVACGDFEGVHDYRIMGSFDERAPGSTGSWIIALLSICCYNLIAFNSLKS